MARSVTKQELGLGHSLGAALAFLWPALSLFICSNKSPPSYVAIQLRYS